MWMKGGVIEYSAERCKTGDRQIRPIRQAASSRVYARSFLKCVQENLLRVEAQLTVLKLTQVGETSSLRRSGERWLRNSANSPRKFAIRGAYESRPQKIGSSNCLSKTQDSAKS